MTTDNRPARDFAIGIFGDLISRAVEGGFDIQFQEIEDAVDAIIDAVMERLAAERAARRERERRYVPGDCWARPDEPNPQPQPPKD